MEKKKDIFKSILILVLIFSVLLLGKINCEKTKELKRINIQINSLWENVLQLQEEYGKIVDKLYNPNYKEENNVEKEY